MRKDILLFLASFTDTDYHELNSFLQKNFGDSLRSIQFALTYLEEKNKIEIMEGSAWPGSETVEPGSWHVSARITAEGRNELNKEESIKTKRNAPAVEQNIARKNWWETEAARKQFLEYQKLKKQSNRAFYIALSAIALTIIIEGLRSLHIL